MTWLIIIAIVAFLAMLVECAVMGVRDLRNRRELRELKERQTPTRPANEAGPGERCAGCGQLPVYEDARTYLRKADDGRLLCMWCKDD